MVEITYVFMNVFREAELYFPISEIEGLPVPDLKTQDGSPDPSHTCRPFPWAGARVPPKRAVLHGQGNPTNMAG